MVEKRASELQVGDTFCRPVYGGGTPRRDAVYTVEGVQFIPVRDFFGKYVDTIQVKAENHLLGPATLTLSAEEAVWVID